MIEFQTRDPLGSAFWDERFDKEFTPWTNGQIPQHLRQYLRQAQQQSCLIPGCGHAYELSAFLEAQWSITAIDFSASAVAQAKTMFPDHQQIIQQADFFAWQPSAPLQSIYERAFLCALPPERRLAIVQRWHDLLPVGGLVFGFFFLEEDQESAIENLSAEPSKRPKGPPFVMVKSELRKLMDGRFVCLEDDAVLDSIAVFAGRERWQVWRRL